MITDFFDCISCNKVDSMITKLSQLCENRRLTVSGGSLLTKITNDACYKFLPVINREVTPVERKALTKTRNRVRETVFVEAGTCAGEYTYSQAG